MGRSLKSLLLVAALLPACTPSCPPGLEYIDGQCRSGTPGEGIDLDERGHPPCEFEAGNGRLDIDSGCADGACDDALYADMVDALGPASCDASDVISETTFCDWQGGALRSHFDDVDLDGVPDPDATARGLYLSEGYDGTSPDGLGLRVSLACFYDVYGEPDEEDRVKDGSLDRVIGMTFRLDNATLYVDDEDLLDGFDGHAGGMSLFAN